MTTLAEAVHARHESVKQIARYFDYEHLAPNLRPVSQAAYDMAVAMVERLPDSPELTAGLRKLLEAKDCFVRAAL